jgi:hypothetical protein
LQLWQNPAVVINAVKVNAIMSKQDIDALYRRFQELCDAYVENPDVLTGLALDDVVGQLKQAAVSQLIDRRMMGLLYDLRRVIPRREPAEFQRLLGEIRDRAIEHNLA